MNVSTRTNFFTDEAGLKKTRSPPQIGSAVVTGSVSRDTLWFLTSYSGDQIRQFIPLAAVMLTVHQKASRFATRLRPIR